jgi:hypothetical protein
MNRNKQIDPINDSIFLSKVQDIRMEMENIERGDSVISESFFTKVLATVYLIQVIH